MKIDWAATLELRKSIAETCRVLVEIAEKEPALRERALRRLEIKAAHYEFVVTEFEPPQ